MNSKDVCALFNQKNFLSEKEKNLLLAMYYFYQSEATASQLAHFFGYSHCVPVNRIVGRLGKKLAKSLNITLRKRDDGSFAGWDVLFVGAYTDQGFLWTMKREIKDGLKDVFWFKREKLPEEIDSADTLELFEGSLSRITVNVYERNPVAKERCVDKYGYKCFVCNFDFEKFYGEIGTKYIHVHHLKPLSTVGKEYKINPESDLRPVCPNCHSMIHRFKESLTIEELKKRIKIVPVGSSL
ncbi:MAG: HNH endonuclease [bacterium]